MKAIQLFKRPRNSKERHHLNVFSYNIVLASLRFVPFYHPYVKNIITTRVSCFSYHVQGVSFKCYYFADLFLLSYWFLRRTTKIKVVEEGGTFYVFKFEPNRPKNFVTTGLQILRIFTT